MLNAAAMQAVMRSAMVPSPGCPSSRPGGPASTLTEGVASWVDGPSQAELGSSAGRDGCRETVLGIEWVVLAVEMAHFSVGAD